MLWDSENDSCEDGQYSDNLPTIFDMDHCARCIEKENIQRHLNNSPLKRHENELSLYGGSSPERRCVHSRRPLEDLDVNSTDSGYGTSFLSENTKFFQFAKSLGVTPRNENSPECASFESLDSMDAEFLQIEDLGSQMDENAHLPADFNSLLSDNIGRPKETSPEFTLSFRPLLRRCVSEDVTGRTPNSSRVRSCLFKTIGDAEIRSFKRPDPPGEEISPLNIKRTRLLEGENIPFSLMRTASTSQLNYSVSEESIKKALHRSSTEPDLIGDFSISFCLPLISGRHQDLKSITAGTLAALMRGEFDDHVASYKIIDCRYPYEYEGGHIAGSENLYTKDQVSGELLSENSTPTTSSDSTKRRILVFHCEFSSERGPNLYRFLRNLDRIHNKDVYPALCYPEVYLLEGGYKCFYEQFANMCVPMAYKPMKHPEHQNDFRHFRSKTKIFNGDRARSINRTGSFKRLGFK